MILVAHLDINVEIFSRAKRFERWLSQRKDRGNNGLGASHIAEDANSGHATFQCDRTRTRKALDRLSGGFEVTSVIQAGKYDES
jgi:hypothetical protein